VIDAVTALQMWAPLIGATIAALAGMRSWRIVGHTEGVVQSLEKTLDRALQDIEANRKAEQEHSGAIRALTASVAKFDNLPRLVESLGRKIDDFGRRLNDGGRDGRANIEGHTGGDERHS
jgi:uncharacterized protein with von Willebrand factor type A (vWA) domain